jgi:hypothetical protein
VSGDELSIPILWLVVVGHGNGATKCHPGEPSAVWLDPDGFAKEIFSFVPTCLPHAQGAKIEPQTGQLRRQPDSIAKVFFRLLRATGPIQQLCQKPVQLAYPRSG